MRDLIRSLLGAVLLPLSLYAHPQPELLFLTMLKESFRDYEICIYDQCHQYECDYAPSYVEQSPGWWVVHTPCVDIEIVCEGQLVDVCSHDGTTIRKTLFGIEILEEMKIEEAYLEAT